jgi:hypothetical protein
MQFTCLILMLITNDKLHFIGIFKLSFSTVTHILEKENEEKSVSAKFSLLKYVSD